MRILFCFAGGSGHFIPLAPLAQAAQAAGHTVAFAGQSGMLATIQAAGFLAFATGGNTLSTTRQPLLKLDRDREDRALRESFAGKIAHERAAAILAVCTTWQPTLIVCDEIDFGAMIAAECLGLPYASVLVIAAGSFVRASVVGAALDSLRAAYSLPPDPHMHMLSRYLVLAPVPPSYRHPDFPLPAPAHAIHPFPGSAAPHAWVAPSQAVPLVYFTLGTIFNLESGDLFERVLAGIRDLPINLIATVGNEIDPSEFGPQPANIQITQYIPQAAILPHCTLAIVHGGSGSVMGALAYGVPMVIIPLGADQPHNADRCADLGVAQVLDAIEATSADIRAAVLAVLNSPHFRQNAERLRAEIASLPGTSYALGLIEQLASERQPVLAT